MREYTIIIDKLVKRNMYVEDRRFTVLANNTKEAREIARKNLNKNEIYEFYEKVIYGLA